MNAQTAYIHNLSFVATMPVGDFQYQSIFWLIPNRDDDLGEVEKAFFAEISRKLRGAK